jgi:hypothetical protein
MFFICSREVFYLQAERHLQRSKPGFCHTIHDPMAIHMESYVSYFEDFQEHTTKPFPLYIEEKHCVEIRHSVPTEDKGQSFPMFPVMMIMIMIMILGRVMKKKRENQMYSSYLAKSLQMSNHHLGSVNLHQSFAHPCFPETFNNV